MITAGPRTARGQRCKPGKKRFSPFFFWEVEHRSRKPDLLPKPDTVPLSSLLIDTGFVRRPMLAEKALQPISKQKYPGFNL